MNEEPIEAKLMTWCRELRIMVLKAAESNGRGPSKEEFIEQVKDHYRSCSNCRETLGLGYRSNGHEQRAVYLENFSEAFKIKTS